MVRRHAGWRLLASLLGVVALVGGACTDDDDDGVATGDGTEEPADGGAEAPAEVDVVTVTATDFAFAVPESVPAGAAQLAIENGGAEPHHAQLFRLNQGATVEDLQQQLAGGDVAALLEVGLFVGGTGTVNPGSTSEADSVPVLQEGTHVLMCFVESPDGTPHVAKGMLQPFEVTAAAEPARAPDAAGEIGLVDYGFELPDELSSGEAYEIVNRGEEPHEMNVLRLEEGATQDTVVEFFGGEPEGPPPFAGVGGMQALLPGPTGRQTLQLGLDPGEYVVLCLIPSVVDGEPHVAKGMITTITVT